MLQAQEPFRPVTTVPNTTRCDGDRVGQTDSLAREPATTARTSLFRSLFHKVERERDNTAVTAHRENKVWLFENVTCQL
jgi:hypothetical protein